MYTRQYMGKKLYWRIKKDGKWTWVAARFDQWENGHLDGSELGLLFPPEVEP